MRRLLIRPGAIGDLIVSLPALEFLKADYTEVWVAGPNVPLVRFADQVCSIASTSLDLLELGRDPESLNERLRSFDSIISWYGTAREEFRAAVRDLPFQFFPALPTAADVHATDFYALQVGASLGAIPRIAVEKARREDFVVIHPFSGGSRKNWPLDRFRELASPLGDVRWTAGPEENLEDAERFESLYELGCWLAKASLYIGNDSGITHLAAAVGTPTIALFGPTDPAVWAPRGKHAHVIRHESLDALPVSRVRELAASVRLQLL